MLAVQTVVVTGSSGGIGSAIAERCIQDGATVFGLSRTLGATPRGATHIATDITLRSQLIRAADRVFENGRERVALVNCAGVCEPDTPAEEMDDDTWDLTLAVNLTAAFRACQVFGTRMLQRGGGAIVNVSSMSGNHIVNTPQRQIAYNSSKAALSAMGRSLSVEWASRGIRVNNISPGYILTPMTAQRADMLSTWTSANPTARMGTPEEVAAAVAFLLSADANYFVGSELLLDGGHTLV